MTATSTASQDHRPTVGVADPRCGCPSDNPHAAVKLAFDQLDLMARRLELFFWTITMTLVVIVLVTLTAQLVLSILGGGPMDPAEMAAAVALASAARLPVSAAATRQPVKATGRTDG